MTGEIFARLEPGFEQVDTLSPSAPLLRARSIGRLAPAIDEELPQIVGQPVRHLGQCLRFGRSFGRVPIRLAPMPPIEEGVSVFGVLRGGQRGGIVGREVARQRFVPDRARAPIAARGPDRSALPGRAAASAVSQASIAATRSVWSATDSICRRRHAPVTPAGAPQRFQPADDAREIPPGRARRPGR